MELPKQTNDEALSAAERDALLASMTAGDWARANSLARLAAFGLHEMGPDDLLQDALTDLLGMVRTWRRGVSPLVTLKVAMHSIASNARKKTADGPIDKYVAVSSGGEGALEGGPQPVHAITEVGPADCAEGRELLANIEQAVEGDDEAGLVLIAWAMGYNGSEARMETGLNAKAFDAARQRLVRKLKPVAATRRAK